MKSDQELCSIKLNESLQNLNSLNPKHIKRKTDREQKMYELTGVNDRLVKKLNASLLNEEKLKKKLKTHLSNLLNIILMLNHLLKYNMWKDNNHFLNNPSILLKFFGDAFQASLCLLSSHV